jgi:CheY-like chemotaxis protein
MKKKIIIAQSIHDGVDQGNTLFARGGLVVLSAGSCEEILDLHRSRKADLIIADFSLPVMGGGTLISMIRRDSALKAVSIIMACERVGPAAEACRRAGANAVLPKPLDPIGLFSTVSQLLMVHQRMSARIPVRISVEGNDARAAFVGMSSDISVSGMLLEAGKKLRIGERLTCGFAVGSHVLSLLCVVVRVQPASEGGFLYGVTFQNLDAKTFVLIEQFVKGNVKP